MCLLRRHLELILPLIDFHALSFSALDSRGNRLKISTFSAWSFVTSSRRLLCVPSVLLLLSSSEVKKKGRSLRAHRCLSFSFCNTSRTPVDLLGVTKERMTSSPTSVSSWELDDGSVSVSGVVGTSGVEGSGSNSSMGSLPRDAKASWSMVGKLSFGGSASKFMTGSVNWKVGNIFLISFGSMAERLQITGPLWPPSLKGHCHHFSAWLWKS